jgi:hypothetical protein
VIEHLLCKWKALCSNPSPTKKETKNKNKKIDESCPVGVPNYGEIEEEISTLGQKRVIHMTFHTMQWASFPGHITHVKSSSQVNSNNVHFQLHFWASQAWKSTQKLYDSSSLSTPKDEIKGNNNSLDCLCSFTAKSYCKMPSSPHPSCTGTVIIIFLPLLYNQSMLPLLHTS